MEHDNVVILEKYDAEHASDVGLHIDLIHAQRHVDFAQGLAEKAQVYLDQCLNQYDQAVYKLAILSQEVASRGVIPNDAA